MLANSTFVLGGAASGKSIWAERLVEASGRHLVYMATGQIFDDEVAAKVAVHVARRDTRWRTVEAPMNLTEALAEVAPQDAVLIDCATMYLTNHLMAQSDLTAVTDELLTGLRGCAAPWVIVSNEVGQGIVPDNALSRQFREAQGRLNIALAAEATLAVQIVAGLPIVLKGTLS